MRDQHSSDVTDKNEEEGKTLPITPYFLKIAPF